MVNARNYYDGKNKFPYTVPVCTYPIELSATAGCVTQLTTLATFPKGSVVWGWRGTVKTAFTSTGSATAAFGITGTGLYSSSIAVATLAVDAVIGPSTTHVLNGGYVCTSDSNFRVAIGTTDMETGKLNLEVFFSPPLVGDLSASIFESIALT